MLQSTIFILLAILLLLVLLLLFTKKKLTFCMEGDKEKNVIHIQLTMLFGWFHIDKLFSTDRSLLSEKEKRKQDMRAQKLADKKARADADKKKAAEADKKKTTDKKKTEEKGIKAVFMRIFLKGSPWDKKNDKERIRGMIRLFKRYKGPLRWVGRRIRRASVDVYIYGGTGEAASTAMLYGGACQIAGIVRGLSENNKRVEHCDISVIPEYGEKWIEYDLDFALVIRSLGMTVLFFWLMVAGTQILHNNFLNKLFGGGIYERAASH